MWWNRIIKWFTNNQKRNHSIKKERQTNEAKNIVESISKSKALYKELIKKTHPDKHPQNRKLAEELTQQVNRAKFNYQELQLLKQKIETELL